MRSLVSIIIGYLHDYMAGRLYGGLPVQTEAKECEMMSF